MTYKDLLYPWCIVRPLANLSTAPLDRFRSLGDAEARLRVLRRLMPTVTHKIVFDRMEPAAQPENPSDSSLRPE